MLTRRDKDILRFLEVNKSISIQQASIIFFQGSYKNASRRLIDLQKQEYINNFINLYNKQKIYYIDRKLSPHDLICLEIYSHLISLGCNIIEFKAQFQHKNGLSYLKNLIKPDAYFRFNYNIEDESYYEFFLEVDLNHYTSLDKMVMYEKLNRDIYKGDMPTLLILRPTTGVQYDTKTLDVIYTDIDINACTLERLFPNA